MKLVIATPLYPPDIAEPAPYVKELVRRLSPAHTIVVVTYGRLPEQVPGVTIHAVNKALPRPLRLVLYTLTLAVASLDAEYIYVQNGPSSELPAGLVARLLRKKLVLGYSDALAHAHAEANESLKKIQRFAEAVASSTITSMPLSRPEILPLSSEPVNLLAYEESWEAHLTLLDKIF